MKFYRSFFPFVVVALLLNACSADDDTMEGDNEITISALRFIGEQVISDGEMFEGQPVGGLSSIDYANGQYYVISDAPAAPIRFYQMSLTFDENSFSAVTINSQTELLNRDGNPFGETETDPEAIRFEPATGNVVWTSEGYTDDRNVNPFIWESTTSGTFVRSMTIPDLFLADSSATTGPRNNGSFEGLCRSANGTGYWAAMELPLAQDGAAPIFGTDTESPVRIAFINRTTGQFGRQFAYELDAVARDGGFTVNGVVEILEYATDQFLVLERSFASGTDDGGNDVHIYRVDASNATDVSGFDDLSDETYTKASKSLLFDFESIRAQLSAAPGSTAKVVDNIEGLTFGPDLANGNKSLVLVADNNFSAFGAQLNQFIVFEVTP
ncbi:MAG: esterase-like activity of phytase family protein [Bacteroidota bacterium]